MMISVSASSCLTQRGILWIHVVFWHANFLTVLPPASRRSRTLLIPASPTIPHIINTGVSSSRAEQCRYPRNKRCRHLDTQAAFGHRHRCQRRTCRKLGHRRRCHRPTSPAWSSSSMLAPDVIGLNAGGCGGRIGLWCLAVEVLPSGFRGALRLWGIVVRSGCRVSMWVSP